MIRKGQRGPTHEVIADPAEVHKTAYDRGRQGYVSSPGGQRSPADEPYSLHIALIQFGLSTAVSKQNASRKIHGTCNSVTFCIMSEVIF